MMTRCLVVTAILLFVFPLAVVAEEYRAEAFESAPPEGLSPDIAALVAPAGYKVVDGDGRTVVELWPAKQWAVKADFAPSASIQYPLEVGTVAGALRFPRKGADFRGQDVARGVYTLRYANQPEDGNHVGTFATRDFLVMLPASSDTSPEALAVEDLHKISAESAGSTHPAIIPLMKAGGEGELPAMRHLEEQEWWTLRFAGDGADGKKLPMELVVVGKAQE
jgi:hypothetical protein